MDMSFDASQVRELAGDLGRATGPVIKQASLLIRKTAYNIEADAKALCPVDTGNLRSSISTSAAGLNAEIGPTASYGQYVEEGTSTHAPQPYMTPAADRREPELAAGFEEILGGIL